MVAPVPNPRELGGGDPTSYAGNQETFHALAAAAIVAVSAGASVWMHGYDGIPGRAGNAGVPKALGLSIDMEPKVAAEAVAQHGFAYLDIALYHPPVYRFLEMRQELGARNIFHPIARLLNPARALSQIVGLSNSHGQREFILQRAKQRGFANLTILTGNIVDFEIPPASLESGVDRVMSIEMFEHMKTYGLLRNKVSRLRQRDAKLFIHTFVDKLLA